MNKDLLQILTLILGSAGIGSLLTFTGVFLTNRTNSRNIKLQLDHQASQDHCRTLRDKGEELYLLVDKWLRGLFGYYLRRNFVMQGKLTYNQCLDLDIQEGSKERFDFGRIDMLIDVYFPSCKASYEQALDFRTKLNEIEHLFKKSYEDGLFEGQKFLSSYIVQQKALEDAGDTLKQNISECLRSIRYWPSAGL